MYLHAIGWQLGKKDKIAIEPAKLKEKQGLYSCPPMGTQKHPFHCCLKVTEEPIKVSAYVRQRALTNFSCIHVST